MPTADTAPVFHGYHADEPPELAGGRAFGGAVQVPHCRINFAPLWLLA